MTRIRMAAAGIVFLLAVLAGTPSMSAQSPAPPSTAQQQQNQEPSEPHPQSVAPAAAPQQQGATPQQQGATRSRIIARTDLVIVPVTVKNSQGQLIGDLTKDEFRVFADSVEQQVILFDSNPFPLSAVVLIGNNLSDKPAEQVQKSLQAIAGGFGPNDEVALVTYDSYQTTVAEFSKSNDDLLTQLKRLEIGSHSAIIVDDPTTAPPTINGKPLPDGTGPPAHGSGRPANDTALYDAVYAAADMLKSRGRERRKIIFLVSDGSNSKHNTHTFDETIHALLADDVTVYSISVSHSLPIGKALVQKGANDLQKFAFDTGGDTFVGSKQLDLERLYSDLTEEARNQYTLTFSPQDIHKDKDFHTIEVRVRRAGLDVTTRQGYYQSAIGIGH
jgi:VWFA-related protein